LRKGFPRNQLSKYFPKQATQLRKLCNQDPSLSSLRSCSYVCRKFTNTYVCMYLCM
jgi:hypothetical protein